MKKVFKGTCRTLLPHPSLEQFNEDTLISTFFNPAGQERGGALDKWFYFYCNPVLDPVVIEIDRDIHLHPGLKRYIGTALREETDLAAWIVSDQQHTAAGIEVQEMVYQGDDWHRWILDQKSHEFTNEQIRTWIRTQLKHRWCLEMPNGHTFVLNPYAQQVAQTYRVADLGFIGALRQMYSDCCEKATAAGTPLRG